MSACPAPSGFVGEFLTLIGAFKVNTWVAFIATSGVILSAAYALWLYRRVMFGELDKPALKGITDLDRREMADAGAAGRADHLVRRLSRPVLDVSAASVEAARQQLPGRHHRRESSRDAAVTHSKVAAP